MAQTAYLAIDIGAESGRGMLTVLDRGGATPRISLHECHRFPTRTLHLPTGLHWSFTELCREVEAALAAGIREAQRLGVPLRSVGVDTWGVDFGLLSDTGELLGLPRAYRDPRNVPAAEAIRQDLGHDAIFRVTGIQDLQFNTLYQLRALQEAEPELLERASRLLFVPDLLHWMLSGQRVSEASIASTAMLVDPRGGDGSGSGPEVWATGLLEQAGLGSASRVLPPVVASGTTIGRLLPDLAARAGLPSDHDPVAVVVPASHDTGSAIAAAPAEGTDWAYLSSGTWSLLGAELAEPVLTDEARAAGFTNERGVGGTVRFLKNIAGLWLVQQVRADLRAGGLDASPVGGGGNTASEDGAWGYAELTRLAAEAEPRRTLLDTRHPPFAEPGGFLQKIRDHAAALGQPVPETPGQFVRACLDSLADAYAATLEELQQVLGRRFDRLHLLGGGGQNQLLNQLTADACGVPVVVGPTEATAIGNGLTQAIGLNDLPDLSALRQCVAASFPLQTYEPAGASAGAA